MEGDRLDVLQEFCLEEDEIFFFAIQKRYWDSTIRTYIYIYIIIKSISTHVHSINSKLNTKIGIVKSELKFIY